MAMPDTRCQHPQADFHLTINAGMNRVRNPGTAVIGRIFAWRDPDRARPGRPAIPGHKNTDSAIAIPALAHLHCAQDERCRSYHDRYPRIQGITAGYPR